MNNKERLFECFQVAMKYMQKYVAIKIEILEGKSETVVVDRKSFIDKLEYCDRNYNDNLELKLDNNIKIVDFCCANDFESIELELQQDE